jgi:hypothetical protein
MRRVSYQRLLFSYLANETVSSFAFCTILSLTLNPPLQVRIVFLCVFTAILVVPPLLFLIPALSFNRPVGTILHWSLRFCTTSLGTFGLLVAIALLSHVGDWETAWSILWVPVMPDSSGRELGLTIFGWILLLAGVVVDWGLYRLIGGSNDQVRRRSKRSDMHSPTF